MKRLILLIFLFGLKWNVLVSQNFVWAKQIGSTEYDQGNSIAVDRKGNTYTMGFFQGSCDFDPGLSIYNLTATRPFGTFISKLDSSGNFVWAKQIGGVSFVSTDFNASSLTIDSLGDIYATAFFDSIVDMDPGPGIYTLSANNRSFFVTKISSSGNLIWVSKIGGTGWAQTSSICLDSSLNVITTGFFSGTIDFDPGIGTQNSIAVANGDCFISKLNNLGNFVWVKTFADSYGNAIVANQQSEIIVTGVFFNTVDFDPSPAVFNLSSGTGGSDIFILKLDTLGNFIWAKQQGGSSSNNSYGIDVDKFGNIYSTGNFSGVVDFDPGIGTYTLATSAAWDPDIFVSKLNSNGGFVWARQIGGTDYDIGNSIKIDNYGDIIIAGGFGSAIVDFDPGPGIYTLAVTGGTVGQGDVFVEKFDAGGNFLWAVQMGGRRSDGALGLCIDTSGNVYTTGRYAPDLFADFDPGPSLYTLSSVNPWPQDIFISKLSKHCFAPTTPTALNTPTSVCEGSSIYFNAVSSGGILWYNSLTSNSSIATGNTFSLSSLPAGNYTFYAIAQTCKPSPEKLTVNIMVNALPSLNIGSNPTFLCSGEDATITVSGGATYLWNSGSTASSFVSTASHNNTYSVIGTDINGCVASGTLTLSVSECVNVPSQQTDKDYNLFPNPSKSVIYISTTKTKEDVVLSIHDINGCLKIERSFQPIESIEINISDLPKGMYHLTIKALSTRFYSAKIIKE